MTATATTFAIGTCLWAGHRFRAETKPVATFTPCPACEPVVMGGREQRSNVKWTTARGKVTSHTCDAACTSAKGDRCSCECGGENHGRDLGQWC